MLTIVYREVPPPGARDLRRGADACRSQAQRGVLHLCQSTERADRLARSGHVHVVHAGLVRPTPLIYMDHVMGDPLLPGGKRVLAVLFVPSVERDGATPIDQVRWADSALETFGMLFGGATAYPKARGIWRDDERGGALVRDEPVVVHCYTTPAEIEDAKNLGTLARFCRRMGRETNQGEIGLVIGDEYFAIRDFREE